MTKLTETQMREISGGRWQCNICKKKFKLWIQLWSWASHDCVNFGYHWVW